VVEEVEEVEEVETNERVAGKVVSVTQLNPVRRKRLHKQIHSQQKI
jgi:hypothetical protein